METTPFTAKKALLQTRIIYFSLLTGITFFFIVALILVPGPRFQADFSNPLFATLLLLTITAIPAGYIVAKKQLSKADSLTSLELKYPVYQSGLLIRLATCEAVSLFSIVCIIVTGNLFSVVFLALSVSVFLLYFPTPGKIGTDINLSETEMEQFYN